MSVVGDGSKRVPLHRSLRVAYTDGLGQGAGMGSQKR